METIQETSATDKAPNDLAAKLANAAGLWGAYATQSMRDAQCAYSDDAFEWALGTAVKRAVYAGTCARMAIEARPVCDACQDAPVVDSFGGMQFCRTCAPKWFVCQECHEAQLVSGQHEIEHPYQAVYVCEACWEQHMGGPDELD